MNENRHLLIIAVDGHSSCGKSTYAKRIARMLKYSYVDSGAMYRAVTLHCMNSGLFDKTDQPGIEEVQSVLDDIIIDLKYNPETEMTETFLNGKSVEREIRSMEVSNKVSYISTIPVVRRKMVEYQRKLGEKRGFVMDGRDIGTVVFPNADIKIFLTASLEVRSMRRFKELQEKGIEGDFESVKQNLGSRDHIDSTRADSPLKQADNALLLDNSDMTVEEQMEWFKGVYDETVKRIADES
jgi:cytidylate kinase